MKAGRRPVSSGSGKTRGDVGAKRAMPTVSVIIPTYQRREWVTRAVGSVLAQRFRDLELIVVDDGSTDGTGEALEGVDERFRYVWRTRASPPLGTPRSRSPAARSSPSSTPTTKRLVVAEDHDLWLRLAALGPVCLLQRRTHVRKTTRGSLIDLGIRRGLYPDAFERIAENGLAAVARSGRTELADRALGARSYARALRALAGHS